MNKYRSDIGEVPIRLRSLPVQNGYPVPWFVAKIEDVYDFRFVEGKKIIPAVKKQLCWICGQKLGTYKAFALGPMCTINRVISEPPSHRECTEWSMRICPFLANRQEGRREKGLPENRRVPAGIGNTRQPKCNCLWITKSYSIKKIKPEPDREIEGGLLFFLGDPTEAIWYQESRLATREEVLLELHNGYPFLLELAYREGEKSIKELEKKYKIAQSFAPEK